MNSEMLDSIMHKVQQNTACHQKYLKTLEKHYKETPLEEFSKVFLKCIRRLFHMDVNVKNPYVERSLSFCAQFCAAIAQLSENLEILSQYDDEVTDPFLPIVIRETLKFHDLVKVEARYHSCRFVTLILQHIGNDTHLDNEICDSIQEAMLERIWDPKASIRMQAIMALVRLQEPFNPDCPVIKAYISSFTDSNSMVRQEVVKRIAPNQITLPKIKERLRDVDSSVRLAAFKRCADVGPRLFKIVDRQSILISGFNEVNKSVQHVFLENLIPKWLTVYNGDYLEFLKALKLDADENDIKNTASISKQVMEVFFRTSPISDIIKALPLNDNKLIPVSSLSSEKVTYWWILSSYLMKADEMEEYLEQIIPELTHFCHYIESYIREKLSKAMDEWEHLDFEFNLYNLFEMVEKYDMADEVGRKTLHSLLLRTLQNHKFRFKIVEKMVSILNKLISDVHLFTNEICQIISEIREPLVEEQPTGEKLRQRDFLLAGLNVKINILKEDKEEAVEKQDFEKAIRVENELVEYLKRHEEINKQYECEKVKVAKDDPDTLCRCLDMLIALLQLPNIKDLLPALRTSKDDFVMPLISNNNQELHWRIMKCLHLYCIIDKPTAEDNAKVMCIPIATYRTTSHYNKNALITSVSAVSDLMRLYGPELFSNDEEATTSSNQNSTRRRLYRNEDMNDVTVVEQNRMTVECIIDVILDMMDDENEEIRDSSFEAIAKLILDEFPVNPLLISRLILKWYNPLTGSADVLPSRPAKQRKADTEKCEGLQQKLGIIIERYTKTIKGARAIVEKAVIPTLTSIANAPKNSPLADVDVDNVLRFFAALTYTNDDQGIVNIHSSLAHSLCYKISSKPLDVCVPFLAKMLVYLEIPNENPASLRELITQAELLLVVVDKAPMKNIMKFVAKLRATLENLTTINEEQTEENLRTVDPQAGASSQKNTSEDETGTDFIEDDSEEGSGSPNTAQQKQPVVNKEVGEEEMEQNKVEIDKNQPNKVAGNGKRIVVQSVHVLREAGDKLEEDKRPTRKRPPEKEKEPEIDKDSEEQREDEVTTSARKRLRLSQKDGDETVSLRENLSQIPQPIAESTRNISSLAARKSERESNLKKDDTVKNKSHDRKNGQINNAKDSSKSEENGLKRLPENVPSDDEETVLHTIVEDIHDISLVSNLSESSTRVSAASTRKGENDKEIIDETASDSIIDETASDSSLSNKHSTRGRRKSDSPEVKKRNLVGSKDIAKKESGRDTPIVTNQNNSDTSKDKNSNSKEAEAQLKSTRTKSKCKKEDDKRTNSKENRNPSNLKKDENKTRYARRKSETYSEKVDDKNVKNHIKDDDDENSSSSGSVRQRLQQKEIRITLRKNGVLSPKTSKISSPKRNKVKQRERDKRDGSISSTKSKDEEITDGVSSSPSTPHPNTGKKYRTTPYPKRRNSNVSRSPSVSDLESNLSSPRRSGRKIRKKNMDDYITGKENVPTTPLASRKLKTPHKIVNTKFHSKSSSPKTKKSEAKPHLRNKNTISLKNLDQNKNAANTRSKSKENKAPSKSIRSKIVKSSQGTPKKDSRRDKDGFATPVQPSRSKNHRLKRSTRSPSAVKTRNQLVIKKRIASPHPKKRKARSFILTSDSESSPSLSPFRKSGRKIKKKNMDDYV